MATVHFNTPGRLLKLNIFNVLQYFSLNIPEKDAVIKRPCKKSNGVELVKGFEIKYSEYLSSFT